MPEHSWEVDPATAKGIQAALVGSLRIEDFAGPIHTVAGADVTITTDGKRLIGGFVVFTWPDLAPIASAVASQPPTFPYIPGLLSFREIPVLISAWSQLGAKPDVIFCDGQGIAHPRGLGLASHLGLLLKCPSVGCAKSRLVGEYEEVPASRGSWRPLMYSGKLVGSVLRTRTDVKPVFVSPGHRVGIDQARKLVLSACIKYRLPEPSRAAHRLVNDNRRDIVQP
jgi:deoxyribonuclease V